MAKSVDSVRDGPIIDGAYKTKPKIVMHLSKKNEKVLDRFGFKKTWAMSPHLVPNMYDKEEWDKHLKLIEDSENKYPTYSWGYEVTCNQEDVVVFLIKNKISFKAEIHYGHSCWFYNAETDELVQAENVGTTMMSYGVDYGYQNKSPIKKMSGKEFLENNQ